jgi:hypothetical protein
MKLIIALLLLAGEPEAPACQRATVVELFRLVATGEGTIEDRARLMADQEENEWALVGCGLFPELATKEATPEQDRAVRDALFGSRTKHKSEIFAYLKYVAPKIFAAPVPAAQVATPRVLPDSGAIEYAVTVNRAVIRVGFDTRSCRVAYLLFPDGRAMLGKIDCLWRSKGGGCEKGNGRPTESNPPAKRTAGSP